MYLSILQELYEGWLVVGTLVWVKRQVPPPHTSHYILHTQLSAPSLPFFINTLCIVYLSGNSAECPSFYSAQKLEPPRALQLYAAGASGQWLQVNKHQRHGRVSLSSVSRLMLLVIQSVDCLSEIRRASLK